VGKQRPEQHEIDELAQRQFRNAFPASWVVREQPKDYGVDYEVEVFDEGVSTGIVFKVQLKGTQEPRVVRDGRCVAQSLSLGDVEYLCKELTVPAVLIVADIAKQRTWWHAIQLDRNLMERAAEAEAKGQKKVTVYIDMENELTHTLEALLRKVSESYAVISVRSVSGASASTLQGALSSVTDLDDALAGLQRGASFLHIERLERLWSGRDWPALRQAIEEVLGDRSSSTEAAFSAWFYVEQLEVGRAFRSGRADEVPTIRAFIADQMRTITRDGPENLRWYAVFAARSALLDHYANQDFWLAANAKVYSQRGQAHPLDGIATVTLSVARYHASVQVSRKFRQCCRLLGHMLREGVLGIFPQCVGRLLESAGTLLLRLHLEGMSDAADAYDGILDQMRDDAVAIAMRTEDWEALAQLAFSHTHSADPDRPETMERRQRQAETVAEMIEDETVRTEILDDIREYVARLRSTSAAIEGGGPDIDEEKQIYSRMAAGLGVDLADPDDEISEIVRIGIEDLDPTRVLKTCSHLYIRLSGGGLPAQMLRLPTAGFKTVYCTLHGHGIWAMSLDGAYSSLEQEHCSVCPDRSPHAADWQWTHEWQQEQDDLYSDSFKPL